MSNFLEVDVRSGKAVVPTEMPAVPENMTGWRRSLRRGSIYHLHCMGESACGSIYLERNKSESASNLGDMQYWGVCPRCLAKSKREDFRDALRRLAENGVFDIDEHGNPLGAGG